MQRTDSFIPENDLKLVILGQGTVGKSSITLRLISGEFTEDYIPTLQETYRKTMVIDDKPLTLGKIPSASIMIIYFAFYEEYS